MRTSLRLGLVLVLAPVGAVACNALLGDFTVAASDGGGDTGSDALDAATEAEGSTQYELTCSENGQRIQVTKGASLSPGDVHAAAIPGGLVRVVVSDYQPSDSGPTVLTYRSYTIDPHNQSNIVPATLPTNASQSLAIERYSAGSHTGFVALYAEYDTSLSTTFLWATRLPDDGSAWTNPVQLVKVGAGLSNLEGDVNCIDPGSDSYYVAYSILGGTSQSTQSIYGGTVQSGGGGVPKLLGTFDSGLSGRNAFDFVRPGIAVINGVGYVMLSPSGNNGPPPLGASVELASQAANVMITPASNLNYFPAAFGTSLLDPSQLDVAFLIADLTQLQGHYNIGQVPTASVESIDPQSLPKTIPTSADGGTATLKDLFVGNGGSPHWEVVNGAEQFIMTQPTVDPVKQELFGGLNVAWWEGATGAVRVYAAGDGHLFADVQFPTQADTTIVTLVGSIAGLAVAYTASPSKPQGNNPPPPADLFLGQIGCLKP